MATPWNFRIRPTSPHERQPGKIQVTRPTAINRRSSNLYEREAETYTFLFEPYKLGGATVYTFTIRSYPGDALGCNVSVFAKVGLELSTALNNSRAFIGPGMKGRSIPVVKYSKGKLLQRGNYKISPPAYGRTLADLPAQEVR
ncbi:uncharacterized protein TERG_11865 [Trichophyton rubrum CBS 118892]|uniref:Uncharacterized protein n=1 Tax=Trichophyton rubrum (strain ATCC MYA-4607 / CBS 118892) TaxID=559305 RepID=A0A080WHT0_TRIRC|nr:uncharacterized protein TERG_11865 [Trichophyton rubrum CBS 118892]KFL60909.1 hypothetical protein TERG_11865 [Trichophyton rubrum CBS 118892]